MRLTIEALATVPAITEGDDLAALLKQALEKSETTLRDGDLISVAHKVVSKAEGRIVRLDEIEPGERATRLSRRNSKDPHHVQVILNESRSLLREEPVIIAESRSGHICANAGVDLSNAEDGTAVLLPEDPDASARDLRKRVADLLGIRPAILISDSFGRPWRLGQADVAIGCAGLAPMDDRRGRPDGFGRPLSATNVAVADQVAAAADLVRTKDSGQPFVLVRGLERHVAEEDGPGAGSALRPKIKDLFR